MPVPNLAYLKLGSGGHLSLFNDTGSTDLIVDVFGYIVVELNTCTASQAIAAALRASSNHGLSGGLHEASSSVADP